jgi:uroporphyrinogen-III decarboxylase
MQLSQNIALWFGNKKAQRTMNPKKRLISALNHKQPDRIPLDFGSTAVTGIHVIAIEKLRKYYGLEEKPVYVNEPYQMLGEIEDDLLDALGIDIVGLFPKNTMFGFPLTNWKEWRAPWAQELLVPADFQVRDDGQGGLFIYPEGDVSAAPSGHMPSASYFFDTIIRQEPIDDSALDPSDNQEEFKIISDEDLSYIRSQLENLKQKNRGIIATFSGTAFGDIALVPAPFMKHPKGIRDVSEWYMSTVTRQDYIHEIFSYQAKIAVQNLTKIHKVIGNEIEAVFICGTDFGTQNSSFCSPDTFASLYMPYYQQVNNWIHEHTTWKTFKHSCGAVERFIDRFIEAGFDILNPVQCTAEGMEPQHLKATYGEKISFWGGGADTQGVLSLGTAKEVYDLVLERCDIFSKDGGFIFNSVHNVQATTPLENITAMIDALNKFNNG